MNRLRSILRTETAQSHEQVDQLFSTLNLSDRRDYAVFIASNHLALSILGKTGFCSSVSSHIVTSVELLQSDLDSLAVRDMTKPTTLSISDQLDPLGVQYVLAGASFGKSVLQSRWARSADELVLQSGRYLASRSNQDLWADFIDRASKTDPDPEHEYIIVKSAVAVFELFATCFYSTESQIASDSA